MSSIRDCTWRYRGTPPMNGLACSMGVDRFETCHERYWFACAV
jgi:hypothetical protein